MNIDSIYAGDMIDFLAWDLEREHGDLGLDTSASKPPLSSFGLAFRKAKPGNSGREWIEEVYETTYGSVVQAKLALDRIHSSASPNAIDLYSSRMPANVHAMFNEALQFIKQQPPSQRDLAMKSIVAVGKKGDSISGLPLPELADLVKERSFAVDPTRIPPRSAEDVVNAARGHLTIIAPREEGMDYTIAAFNPLFHIYAYDDYNDELVMANSLLNKAMIPRAFTTINDSYFINAPPKAAQEAPKQSRQDIIGELKTFRSPKLSAKLGQKSPPLRRESSGLNRSFTFFTTGAALKPTPPPQGLGLEFGD